MKFYKQKTKHAQYFYGFYTDMTIIFIKNKHQKNLIIQEPEAPEQYFKKLKDAKVSVISERQFKTELIKQISLVYTRLIEKTLF